MKRVLITGKDSYIGTSVEQLLNTYPSKYAVDVIDMVGNDWKQCDFRPYDVVYHVAGIAHRHDASDELFERVNYRLAVDVAEKASRSDVKQFIFMSSGAVYTQSDRKHPVIVVDKDTALNPTTAYGKSKLAAENALKALDSKMKVAIIRPPMVYGPNAKGNYQRLSSIAKVTPAFPRIENKRSMIYIDNLTEFVRLLIEAGESGTYLPQNREYVNVTNLVQCIAECHGRKVLQVDGLYWAIRMGGRIIDEVNKVFGDFYYVSEEYFNNAYQVVDFNESIRLTEKVMEQ